MTPYTDPAVTLEPWPLCPPPIGDDGPITIDPSSKAAIASALVNAVNYAHEHGGTGKLIITRVGEAVAITVAP